MKRAFIVIASAAMSLNIAAENIKDQIVALVAKSSEVFRYGYEELTDQEKAAYDQTLEDILRFDADSKYSPLAHSAKMTSYPTSVGSATVINMLTRLKNDVPELFILSHTIPRYDKGYWEARVGIYNTPESTLSDLQKMEKAYGQIAGSITKEMSTYQKLRILHDSFISWANYGDMSGADGGTAKGALINRRAVCEGLSRGFLYLCQRAGLKCIYVSGSKLTSPESGTWGNHAWNYVEIDGKWYLIDIANDGGFANSCGYISFLRGKDHIEANYRHTDVHGSDPNLNGVYKALPPLGETTYTPEKTLTSYKVTFMNWTGYVLRIETIVEGTNAVEPVVPEREGYVFKGWDKDFSKVTGNMTINPIYEAEETETEPEPTPIEVSLTTANEHICIGEYASVTASCSSAATYTWTLNGETYGGAEAEDMKSSETWIAAMEVGEIKVKVEAEDKATGAKGSAEITLIAEMTPAYSVSADKYEIDLGSKITLRAQTFAEGDTDDVRYKVKEDGQIVKEGIGDKNFSIEFEPTTAGEHSYQVAIESLNGCKYDDQQVSIEVRNLSTGIDDTCREKEDVQAYGIKGNVAGPSTDKLPRGIYIVKRRDGTSYKKIVR